MFEDDYIIEIVETHRLYIPREELIKKFIKCGYTEDEINSWNYDNLSLALYELHRNDELEDAEFYDTVIELT